jgi:hypothetical protein
MDSTVLTKHSNAKTKKVVQLDNPKNTVVKSNAVEPDLKELLALKLQQLETEPLPLSSELPGELSKTNQAKVE